MYTMHNKRSNAVLSFLSFLMVILQVVMFTVNPNGQWAILHGNPLITYVKANDEVEDVILRFGRRR